MTLLLTQMIRLMHERIAEDEQTCATDIFKKFGKNVDFEVGMFKNGR